MPKTAKTRKTASSEGAPADLAGITAYLRAHPHAKQAELSGFLRRRLALPRPQAADLARTILAGLAEQRRQEALGGRLLLDLLRVGSAPVAPNILHNVSWSHAVALAIHHGVGPLLYEGIIRAGWGDRAPARELDVLRRARADCGRRNAALLAEADRVLGAWASAGVEAIALKGLALVPTLYGDPALRPMGDLDLMVRQDQVDAAEAVLRELGYRPCPLNPELRPPAFLRAYGGSAEHGYKQGDDWVMLDLHWRLTNSEWIRRTVCLDVEELWATSEPWSLGQRALRKLGPCYQLVHLALHLLKHKFGQGSLRMLVDLDRLWRAEGERIAAGEILELAGRARVRASLYLALWACQRWLGTPVPPALLAGLAPSTRRARQLQRLIAGPQGDYPSSEIRGRAKFLLQLLLLDNPLRALPAGLKVLFPGARWLRARYGVEGIGCWRYRLLHPFRVIWRGEL